jgi:hypothetical protein
MVSAIVRLSVKGWQAPIPPPYREMTSILTRAPQLQHRGTWLAPSQLSAPLLRARCSRCGLCKRRASRTLPLPRGLRWVRSLQVCVYTRTRVSIYVRGSARMVRAVLALHPPWLSHAKFASPTPIGEIPRFRTIAAKDAGSQPHIRKIATAGYQVFARCPPLSPQPPS